MALESTFVQFVLNVLHYFSLISEESMMQTEWLYDGHIVTYKVTVFSRETIYKNSETVKEIIRTWPSGRPYLALMDYTENPNLALTPYLRQRAEDILKTFPRLHGRIAVVMKKSAASQTMRLFIKYGLGHKHKKLEREIFFSHAEALAWLSEKVAVASAG